MRLFEIAACNDVVEDHRYAERVNLDRLVSSVFDVETQDQTAIFDQPQPGDLNGNVCGKCRREIGDRESLSGCGQRLDRFARISRIILLPWTRTARAQPQRQISKMVKTIRRPPFEPICRREIKSGG